MRHSFPRVCSADAEMIHPRYLWFARVRGGCFGRRLSAARGSDALWYVVSFRSNLVRISTIVALRCYFTPWVNIQIVKCCVNVITCFIKWQGGYQRLLGVYQFVEKIMMSIMHRAVHPIINNHIVSTIWLCKQNTFIPWKKHPCTSQEDFLKHEAFWGSLGFLLFRN